MCFSYQLFVLICTCPSSHPYIAFLLYCLALLISHPKLNAKPMYRYMRLKIELLPRLKWITAIDSEEHDIVADQQSCLTKNVYVEWVAGQLLHMNQKEPIILLSWVIQIESSCLTQVVESSSDLMASCQLITSFLTLAIFYLINDVLKIYIELFWI